MGNDLQSVDKTHASKHPSIQNREASKFLCCKSIQAPHPSNRTIQTKLDCVGTSSRGLIAVNLAGAGWKKCVSTAQSISVYPLAWMGNNLQSVDEIHTSKHPSIQIQHPSPPPPPLHTCLYLLSTRIQQTNKARLCQYFFQGLDHRQPWGSGHRYVLVPHNLSLFIP